MIGMNESVIKGTCWRCAELKDERERLKRINVGLSHANKFLLGQLEGAFQVGKSMLQGLEAERDAATERAKRAEALVEMVRFLYYEGSVLMTELEQLRWRRAIFRHLDAEAQKGEGDD